MNFLAHFHLSNELQSPAYKLGTVLPDLARVAHPHFRIKNVPGLTHLEQGINAHHQLDDWFHQSDFLQNALKYAATVEHKLQLKPYRAFFFRHLISELLIDHCLAVQSPSLIDGFYHSISATHDEELYGLYLKLGKADLFNPFRSLLQRFIEDAFLYNYATLEGVAESVERVYARVVKAPTGLSRQDLYGYLQQHLGYICSEWHLLPCHHAQR